MKLKLVDQIATKLDVGDMSDISESIQKILSRTVSFKGFSSHMNFKRMSDQIDKDLKEAFIARDNNNDLKKQSEFISREESSIKINSI